MTIRMGGFLGQNVTATIIVVLLLVVLVARNVSSFTLFPSHRAIRPATTTTGGTNHGRRRTTRNTTTTTLSNSAEHRGGRRHWLQVLATSTTAVIAVSPMGAAVASAVAAVGAPIPISVPIRIPTRSDYKTSVYDFDHEDCTTDCVLACRAASSSKRRTRVSPWNTKGVGPPEIDDENDACVRTCVRAGRRYCQQETPAASSSTMTPRYIRTTREPTLRPSHNRRRVLPLRTIEGGVVEDE